MSAVLNIRATEISSLRDKNRSLHRRLVEMESVIRDNDAMVAMMHRLAVLLIARNDDWRTHAESMLRRGMKTAGAHIYLLQNSTDPLSTKIARIPVGGRADDSPLCDDVIKGALYYHLPLKNGRRAAGLLTLTLRQKRDFREGDDDFCRRLAELLSAALTADKSQAT